MVKRNNKPLLYLEFVNLIGDIPIFWCFQSPKYIKSCEYNRLIETNNPYNDNTPLKQIKVLF